MNANHTAKPQACPLTEDMILEILRGNLLTLRSLCDKFHQDLSIEPEDFYPVEGVTGPDGIFSRGLSHILVECQGEQFALVRPDDFGAFVDAGWKAGGAQC